MKYIIYICYNDTTEYAASLGQKIGNDLTLSDNV